MDEHSIRQAPSEPAASWRRWAWVRRWLFWLTAGTIVGAELSFLVVFAGAPVGPVAGVLTFGVALPLLFSVAALALERGRGVALEPDASAKWLLVGVGMTAVWTAVYFSVSRLVDPGRVQLLSSTLESRIPLVPDFSLLYVLLYPMFFLPYTIIRDRLILQRLVLADAVMILLCSTLFLAVPVGIERPAAAAVAVDGLGSWVLQVIYRNDVPWNCMPSEHCMAAMISSLAIWEGNRKVGAFAFLATALIGLSTLFTKQHYLVDVVVGYTLAVTVYAGVRWAWSFTSSPAAAARARAVTDIGEQKSRT